MNIAATDLKTLLKQVNSVKGENLVFDVDGGVVVSDSDITIRAYSDKFTGFGSPIQINARKFNAVLNRMSGICDINLTGNTLTIKSAKTKVDMEFSVPKPTKFQVAGVTHTLPLVPVRDLLKYVAVAANPNKAALTGGVVQFNTVTKGLFEGERVVGLEAMGTDDKRCAFAEISLELVGVVPFSCSIPLPAVVALQSLSGTHFELGETPSHYVIRSSGTTIHANKLSKTFPNFKSFLPKAYSFTAVLGLAELKRVLYTVEPMVNQDEANAISVHFLDGRLNIRTVGKGGVAEDEMEFETDPLAESEFKIKLNHKFLADYLNTVTEDVVFNANTPTAPIVLESGQRKLMMTAVAGGTE